LLWNGHINWIPLFRKCTNQGEQDQVENTIQFKTATSDQLIPQLQRGFELRLKFGTWEMGTINRFQRPNGDINLQYNDAAESLPVAFGPAIWEVYQHKQLSGKLW
jgi:hypothetical protein